MGKYSSFLVALMLSVALLVIVVVAFALSRQLLFWYWRGKGTTQTPKDILHQNHETALIVKKSIEELKAEEIRQRQAGGA